jgi:RecG-like helicase
MCVCLELLHGKKKQQEKKAVLAKFNRYVLQLVLCLRVCLSRACVLGVCECVF